MDEVIAQFEKNATEVVRVSLTEYRGRQLIDLRVYYSDDEGQYRPTKKGVSLAVGLYGDFKKALHSLEKALLERQLITRDDLEEAGLAEVEED
jgi:predicted phosphoadenosine phosphosulfate sulfurtransferase